jgi:hypothetical protein
MPNIHKIVTNTINSWVYATPNKQTQNPTYRKLILGVRNYNYLS